MNQATSIAINEDFQRRLPDTMLEQTPTLLFVILAHNEQAVIGGTLQPLVDQLAGNDRVVVVADNCDDDTVLVAQEAGAHVLSRAGDTAGGKGAALKWFLAQAASELDATRSIVILDADSQIGPDFAETIRGRITDESRAFQCFVHPLASAESPISKLAGLSELIDQRVGDRIRTRFGWPVRLRGTGMVIPCLLLAEIAAEIETHVEDLALSLLLAARGIAIERIDEALVFDPKPVSASAATIQRARWFRGQWLAAWRYRREIAQIALQGPGGWFLLSNLFLRPKWLVLCFSAAATLLTWGWPPVALLFGVHFLAGFVYLVMGSARILGRRAFADLIWQAPAYIWMWLKGLLLSPGSADWRKARD